MPKQARFPLPKPVAPGHYMPAPLTLLGYRAEFALRDSDARPCVHFSTVMGQPQGSYVFVANCKVQAMEAMARQIIEALDVINSGRI